MFSKVSIGGVCETIQNRDNNPAEPVQDVRGDVDLWIFLSIWINLKNNGSRECADEVHDKDGDDDEGHVALPPVLLFLLVEVLQIQIVQTALLSLYHMDIYTVLPFIIRSHIDSISPHLYKNPCIAEDDDCVRYKDT